MKIANNFSFDILVYRVEDLINYYKTVLSIFIFSFIFTNPNFSMEIPVDAVESHAKNVPELEKFAQKYAPTTELKKLIDTTKGLEDKSLAFLGKPAKYVCKGVRGFDRIINAERLRKIIQKNNLTCLDVAKKYIYKVNNKWVTFADYIEGCDYWAEFEKKLKGMPKGISHRDYFNVPAGTDAWSHFQSERLRLSLQQTQQLAIIAEESGYIDWTWENLIRTPSGKLVFIDTEQGSFRDWTKLELIRRFEKSFGMTVEAAKWLNSRISFLENNLNEGNARPSKDKDLNLADENTSLKRAQILVNHLQ